VLRWGRRHGRQLAVWAVVLAAVTSAGGLSGCSGSAKAGPQAVYQSIYGDYLHGSLDAAEARADKARQEYSTGSGGENSPWSLKFRLLQAEILLRQNRPKDVIALLTGGVSFPRAGDIAIKRNLLCGRAHFSLGLAQQSDQELRDARRLAESTHSGLIGEVLRTEALDERDSGNPDKAIERFRSSLLVARERGDSLLEAADLVDIGFWSLQSGHFDQAVVSLQEAANFAKSVQARRQLQMALGNMGWAYQNLGDFDRALTNFQEAELQAKEIGMTSYRVIWLQDAGLAEFKLGHLEEARKYDEQALQYALTLPAANETNQIVNIETNLALLLWQQGQHDAAKNHTDAAMLAVRNSKDANVVAYAMFIQGLIAARRAKDQQAKDQESERLLTSALQLATDPEIKSDIENTLANLYSGRRQAQPAELWYRRSIQTFEDERASVRSEALRLSAFAYGDAVYRDYAQFLIDAQRPIEALQLLDRSRARTLEEGLGVADAELDAQGKNIENVQAVARKLDAKILFYSLGSEKSYLWVISANETRLFTLPNEKEIQSAVDEYQRAIQKSTDPKQTQNPAAVSLYTTLIGPAAAMIPEGSKIFLIPDGALHALNFETLLEPAPRGFKYWIEDVTVTTTSSIRMLSRATALGTQPTPKELLLIGNPISAGSEFEALPNASAEIEHIEKHFSPDGQTVLTQARAVPAAYTTSGPDRFRYIHFVAHGTANRSSPLDSAVVLSPAQKNPEDFKLYARDIVQHPLHARLVTISTCYGSGLRTYAGEGLVGLAWAFLRAGSHNVIGALWQADDASTPLLMDRLYSELEDGKTPAAALRAAKLSLIHSDSVYRKPFYWGAFQLYAGS
jgi:CHAT domain-containing protein